MVVEKGQFNFKIKEMIDFLTFKSFITPTVLILFYYIGAVIIPIFSFTLMLWIKDRYFKKVSLTLKESITSNTTLSQRIIFIAIFIGLFLLMELFWRMMFEFLIAYFDMHDSLMRLSEE